MIYLDHNAIVASKVTDVPMSGRTLSGYGNSLPTCRMVKLANGRWYRVRAICYANAASHYIEQRGFGKRFIDGYCEDAIIEKDIG